MAEHAHAPGDWVIVTAATATTAGGKQKVCSVCGFAADTEVIRATETVPEYKITAGKDGTFKKLSAKKPAVDSCIYL